METVRWCSIFRHRGPDRSSCRPSTRLHLQKVSRANGPQNGAANGQLARRWPAPFRALSPEPPGEARWHPPPLLESTTILSADAGLQTPELDCGNRARNSLGHLAVLAVLYQELVRQVDHPGGQLGKLVGLAVANVPSFRDASCKASALLRWLGIQLICTSGLSRTASASLSQQLCLRVPAAAAAAWPAAFLSHQKMS